MTSSPRQPPRRPTASERELAAASADRDGEATSAFEFLAASEEGQRLLLHPHMAAAVDGRKRRAVIRCGVCKRTLSRNVQIGNDPTLGDYVRWDRGGDEDLSGRTGHLAHPKPGEVVTFGGRWRCRKCGLHLRASMPKLVDAVAIALAGQAKQPVVLVHPDGKLVPSD